MYNYVLVISKFYCYINYIRKIFEFTIYSYIVILNTFVNNIISIGIE